MFHRWCKAVLFSKSLERGTRKMRKKKVLFLEGNKNQGLLQTISILIRYNSLRRASNLIKQKNLWEKLSNCLKKQRNLHRCRMPIWGDFPGLSYAEKSVVSRQKTSIWYRNKIRITLYRKMVSQKSQEMML